ncbi:hypothetical protein ACXR0O_14005 [Verrucomicrobiota bacterium sgz303538]
MSKSPPDPRELAPAVVAVLCRVFNQDHARAAKRLTVRTLLAQPRGNAGKNGWFCEYSLFTRRGNPVLATFCGHRMTNEHYKEIGADGECVFSWESYGGMEFVGGYPDEHLANYRRARRRAARVGIKIHTP